MAFSRHIRIPCIALFATLAATSLAMASDWTRFRGPDGLGMSDAQNVPVSWSDTKNLKWKIALPGRGSSSPVVLGDRVFLTCYSGYGVNDQDPGDIEKLTRHLLCVRRKNGEVAWTKSVKAEMPEDPYTGGRMGIGQHGYASNTPVTDGQNVYAFFGKSGVFAFDLSGRQLWHADVGHESSNRRWGSAASLILTRDLVIVNASEESQSVRGLDKRTGQEVWKAEAAMLELTYGTPLLIENSDGSEQILVAVPEELWALNPQTGKLTWYAETGLAGNASPSVIASGGIVYAFGGFPRQGSIAVRIGQKGDVTQSNVLWTSQTGPYIPTPVLVDGRLYWANRRGIAVCMDADTGKIVYEQRLQSDTDSPSFYASPVLAEGKLYAVSRTAGTFVIAADPKFQQLAQNHFASDDSEFNGTPVIIDGQILLRSNRCLYCVAE